MEIFPWWTEDQKKLADEVEEFVEKLIPRSEEAYWKKEVPWDLLKKIAGKGYFGVGIPKKYNGMGLGVTGTCIVQEAVSRLYGVTHIYCVSMLSGLHQLNVFGTEEQKEKWFPRIAKGEIGGVAITEPFVGSDVASTETIARREGEGYILTGRKRYIMNVGIAGRYVVYARTSDKEEDIARNTHLSAFILEKGAPGFTVEKINELIGFTSILNGYLNLDEVPVPVENRIGAEGLGFMVAMSGLNYERTVGSAAFYGGWSESLKYVNWYMRRRVQFGEKTIDLPTNQFKIADLIAGLKTGRLLTYYSAYLIDLGREDPVYSSIAKLYATDEGLQAAINATQLLGGDGVTEFYPIGRMVADGKIGQIVAGTNEIMRYIIYRMGIRNIQGVPRRKIHKQLGVPLPVAGSSEKEKGINEEKLLKTLAEDYRVNPGLYMHHEDIKELYMVEDKELDNILESLEKKKLVKLYRRHGAIELAKATYKGLNKANPPEYYRWFPDWVDKKNIS
jgi:alkylation response protein AidB-like acyl-CoA dehydrogenase